MGLAVMILGLVLFLGVHTLTTQRELRAQRHRRDGRGRLQDRLYAGVGRGPRAGDLGLCQLSRDRVDRRLESTDRAQAHLTVALMLPAVILVVASYIRGRIYTDAETSDAVGRQAVGGGASARQWRSRLDHPVRLVPGLGGVRPHLAETSHRRRRAADPGRRPGNDLIAVAVGIVAYLALAFAFHPVVIGVPVVGV